MRLQVTGQRSTGRERVLRSAWQGLRIFNGTLNFGEEDDKEDDTAGEQGRNPPSTTLAALHSG